MVIWYNTDWPYRKLITLQASKISGSSTNFPVLIRPSGSDIYEHAKSDGTDIIFVFSSNNIRVNCEMEHFTNGSGCYWVRVPSLTDKTDEHLWIYYGEGTDHSGDVGYKASGTWDTNYLAVYHLNETTGTVLDSTVNDEDSISENVEEQGKDVGHIYKACHFDNPSNGNSQMITLPWVIDGNNTLTIETFFWPSAANTENAIWDFSHNQVSPANLIYWYLGHKSTNYEFSFESRDDADVHAIWTTTVPMKKWHYIVGKTDINNNDHRLFVDNEQRTTSTTTTDDLSLPSANTSSFLGAAHLPSYTTSVEYGFTGYMDEARASKVVRTNGWLLTTYNTIISSSTFYTAGVEEKYASALGYEHYLKTSYYS